MIQSFFPPKQRHMGAGPCVPHPRVLSALSKPPISHLDEPFLKMMTEIRELLQYVLKTKNTFTIPFQGPASAAMEASLLTLLERGEKIIICVNGLYSERMADMALRHGCEVILLEQEWGEVIDENRLERILKLHQDAKFIGLVHTETMTGTMCDLKSIADLARRYGRHLIVDATGTFLNAPLETDAWGIDVLFTNSQKCLAAPAGLAPLTLSERMIEHLQRRKTPVANWCMDLGLIVKNWYKHDPLLRTYHHNPPINLLYALHEALLLIQEEGIDPFIEKQRILGTLLKNGLKCLGLKEAFPVSEALMIPNMFVAAMPEGLNAKAFHEHLVRHYYLWIGEGLGKFAGKVLRVSTMGHCTADDVYFALTAIESTLHHFGRVSHVGKAQEFWASQDFKELGVP